MSRNNDLNNEYIYRINKVLDYIDSNISAHLSLERLSSVANFSSYHFHRIFSTIMGEPLSKYIQRVRLEKAVLMILSDSKYSIGDMAAICGFENQASFSRAFNVHFGFSASALRKDKNLLESKKCKTESKTCKDTIKPYAYNESVAQPLRVDVKSIKDMTAIYMRVIGLHNADKTVFQKKLLKLFKWAEIRDLIQFPETKILSLYHDHPDITEDMKFRTSLCITVPPHTQVEGEIGKMVIPGGKYAVGHFVIGSDAFKSAWDFLWGEWLPESGYQPDDRPCFEVYLNHPDEHPAHKSIVEIYVPVKPL